MFHGRACRRQAECQIGKRLRWLGLKPLAKQCGLTTDGGLAATRQHHQLGCSFGPRRQTRRLGCYWGFLEHDVRIGATDAERADPGATGPCSPRPWHRLREEPKRALVPMDVRARCLRVQGLGQPLVLKR